MLLCNGNRDRNVLSHQDFQDSFHKRVNGVGWHWTRILLHIYGSDEAAIEALPELHREFLAERAAIGDDGIEAALDQRLIEVYGEPWYAPPVTNTTTMFDS